MREGVIEIARFLKKPLTERQLTGLCQYLDLKSFANNELTNFEIVAKGIGLAKPEQHFPRKDGLRLLHTSITIH